MPEPESERPRLPHDVAAPAAPDAPGGAPGEPEDALLAAWVFPDPYDRGPASARVTERGPEVWALAGYLKPASRWATRRRALLREAAADFHLPEEALLAALAFYRRHRAAIDARVAENGAALDAGPGCAPRAVPA
jgi:hypothetical protein